MVVDSCKEYLRRRDQLYMDLVEIELGVLKAEYE